MAYTVLMVDIRKSRQYQQQERQELQDFCLKAVELLNGIFSEALVKNVEFSAGDELQGLFKRMDAAFLYLRLFRMLLWDKDVYAGIGHGDWTVQVVGRGTTFQDGPAYHYARKALEACKKAKDYSVVFCTDEGVDNIMSAIINSIFCLNERITSYQNDLRLLLEILWPVGNSLILNESYIWNMGYLLKDKYALSVFKKEAQRSIFKIIKKIDFPIPAMRKRKDIDQYSSPAPVEKDIDQYSSPAPVEKDIDSCNSPSQARKDYDVLMSGHIHGAVASLAEMTGLKRQSIEQGLKNSNIFVERNTAFALVEYLQRELKGGNE